MSTVSTTLLRSLFEKQREYISFFFNHLELQTVEKLVDLCLHCKGLVLLTGVGKSGIIAEKIAMTLVSTGTRSLFLPGANLLHGDIGAVASEDLFLILSKSGKTQELVDLVPYLRKKKCQIVAIVSDFESPLGKMADHVITLPVEKELCPFDLAPTISTAVQLLFGDLLAMALMREKGFSLEEYAGNHPSGAIGKKITHKVCDLMKTGNDLPLCGPKDRLVDVIVELSNKRCGCLLVCNPQKKLLGIFTEGDLGRFLQKEGPSVLEKAMEELMTRMPITVSPQLLAYRAMQKMQESRRVMMAPVIEKEKVVGLIHMHDIVHEEI